MAVSVEQLGKLCLVLEEMVLSIHDDCFISIKSSLPHDLQGRSLLGTFLLFQRL